MPVFVSSAAENASSVNQSRRIAARELFAMNRVRCSGTEDDIQACTFSSSSSCSGSRAVRVNCSPNPGIKTAVSYGPLCISLMISRDRINGR